MRWLIFALFLIMLGMEMRDPCTFIQKVKVSDLIPGETAVITPHVRGCMRCGGLYAYSHQFTAGDFESITYIALGKVIPKRIKIPIRYEWAGVKFRLFTEMKCEACGHTSQCRVFKMVENKKDDSD